MSPPSPSGFPAFLVPAFNQEHLARSGATVVAIDAEGTILWVNPAWRRFAEENGGDGVALLTSYFEGITEPLRSFYELSFAEALSTGRPFEQDYDCSSPTVYRAYRLRALPVDRFGLLLEHSLVVQHPREAGGVQRAAADYVWPNGVITQCGNCRRVRRPETHDWDWVAALVEAVLPIVSHAICPSCIGFYWRPRR